MTDSFVPLLAPSAPATRPAGAGSSPVQVISGNDNGAVFQALSLHVKDAFHSPSESANPASTPCEARPKLTVHRDGDRVTCIQIRCACGQTIELDCVY
ncbi:MAG TPA: hypothetical protein VHH73_02080 [Verrucomicrobiae bacterium]|nr:hypothetical protein [Verrucomicrobiae bacterium]